MDKLNEILGSISGVLWGIPLIVLIVGSGIYLTIRVGVLQLRLLPTALRLVFSKNMQQMLKAIFHNSKL